MAISYLTKSKQPRKKTVQLRGVKSKSKTIKNNFYLTLYKYKEKSSPFKRDFVFKTKFLTNNKMNQIFNKNKK